MFTGIVRTVGTIEQVELQETDGQADARLHVACPELAAELQDGDSIATSGVCLTAAPATTQGFWCDASAETLSCTTLQRLRPGTRVNLEPALSLATPLGGHLVSGHVDGVGELVSRTPEARSVRFVFAAPAALGRYIAAKGAICVDGVSLTVNEVDGSRFGVNIVPHTLQATTFGALAPGDPVNLEVDLVARYLERLLEARD